MEDTVRLQMLTADNVEEGMVILRAFFDKATVIHNITDPDKVQKAFHLSVKETEDKLAEIGLQAPWRKRWT